MANGNKMYYYIILAVAIATVLGLAVVEYRRKENNRDKKYVGSVVGVPLSDACTKCRNDCSTCISKYGEDYCQHVTGDCPLDPIG